MSVSYSTTAKNARLQVIADLVAGKTVAAATGTATAGLLIIGTSALSGATGVLATIPLNTTPATVSSGVLTITGTPSASASATGTAAKAQLRDSAGTVVVDGLTVGTSAADIIVSSVSVTAAQTVTVNSGTITHSA